MFFLRNSKLGRPRGSDVQLRLACATTVIGAWFIPL